MKTTRAVLAIALAVGMNAVTGGQAGSTGDWPQWQGPDRNGLSKDTGLLSQWPSSGPPKAWAASGLGGGYGSVAVKGDRIYLQGLRDRQSIVSALNRADGARVWSKALGASGSNDQGDGPRGTPAIDGDRIYVLTENGDLWCLKTDGSEVWHRNILRDFNGRNLRWLISESPLVDGNHVIVSPGGNDAGMVALDKTTGKTVWTSKGLSDPAGYSSPIVADVGGVRTYMTLTSSAGVGVRARDGKLMWRYDRAANNVANITTPVFFDNKVFYTSAYDTGAALLALTPQNDEVRASEVYFTRNMRNHHGGVVLVNGYLYGYSDSILTCLEFATGKPMWRDRSVGKGAVTYADGHLYLQGENNVIGLAQATPNGYVEKGRFTIPDEGLPSWAHPVVTGGRLYVRNQGTLFAYDVRAR